MKRKFRRGYRAGLGALAVLLTFLWTLIPATDQPRTAIPEVVPVATPDPTSASPRPSSTPTSNPTATPTERPRVRPTTRPNRPRVHPQPTILPPKPTDPSQPTRPQPSKPALPKPPRPNPPPPPAQPGPVKPGGSTFSIAILPDTQAWTGPGENRFDEATRWLASQKQQRNIRAVGQTGDLSNWGWLDPRQYRVADQALSRLSQSGIPYLTTAGNHDTRAVGWNNVKGSRGYGGGAYMYNPECPERLGASQCNSSKLIRQTAEYGQNLPGLRRNVQGTFEPGRYENAYLTFTGGGKKWLMLSLEMAPRPEAITWASGIVQRFSDHNVIVQTHYYLDSNGAITASKAGYGMLSGNDLYQRLISKYSNIKLVFSGHTGAAAYREDVAGNNKVVSMLQNDVSNNQANPIRLVTIDTATGNVKTEIYAPRNKTWYRQYDRSSVLQFR